MGLHNKRGGLSHDSALESRAVRRDLGLLGGSDVDVERALGYRLTAECDGDDVFADLLRIIAAFKRGLVHLHALVSNNTNIGLFGIAAKSWIDTMNSIQ